MITLARKLERCEAFIGRGLEGFQSRPAAELQPTGVAELDSVLGGGFPRGSLVELCGPACSGRTSLAYSLLAQVTGRQEVCAFVDVSDSLDPLSLAAAGVDLERLLWIRCGEGRDEEPNFCTSPYFVPAEKETGKLHDLGSAGKKTNRVYGWGHPRELMRGVDQAIPSVVGKQAVFAAPEQIQVVARNIEQVERDRELPRRGIRPLRSQSAQVETYSRREGNHKQRSGKPWKRLEQALKSADVLLHSGAWGVVVVDLGGVSWADARRINLSMWFRFRRAVENTPTILLLLGEEACAKSCASLVLRCHRKTGNWNRAATKIGSSISTFEGFEVQGEVVRSRVLSQSADFVRWQTRTP